VFLVVERGISAGGESEKGRERERERDVLFLI